MSNLNTFHPFPRLPSKLRLKIWSFFGDDPPHIIPLHHHREPYRLGISCHGFAHIFHHHQPVPPILHINRESRALGLETYQSGWDVSQSLSTKGMLWQDWEWAPLSDKPYQKCPHEEQFGDRQKLFWRRDKDLVYLSAPPEVEGPIAYELHDRWGPLHENTGRPIVEIWSMKCDLRFGRLRWLALESESWNKGMSFNAERNTIITGMEVVFVVLSQEEISALREDKRFTSEEEVRAHIRERGQQYQEKIKGKWEGPTPDASPEVRIVFDIDEAVAEVQARTV